MKTARPISKSAEPAEDVAEAAAEEQQAAEGERVGVEHPRERGRAEAEVGVDARERDVHDGGVEDEHQLGDQHDRDAGGGAAGVAAAARSGGRAGIAAVSREVIDDMRSSPVLARSGRGTVDPEDDSASSTTIRRLSPFSKGSENSVRADAKRNYDRIVEVAREVFREQGYDASLDEVAKRAGVGPGTLYRHFPTPRRPHRRDHAELGRPRRGGGREGARPRGRTRASVLLHWFEEYVRLISLHKGGPAKITGAMGDDTSPIRTKCQVLQAAGGRVLDRAAGRGRRTRRRHAAPGRAPRRRGRHRRRPVRPRAATVRPMLEVVADGLLT